MTPRVATKPTVSGGGPLRMILLWIALAGISCTQIRETRSVEEGGFLRDDSEPRPTVATEGRSASRPASERPATLDRAKGSSYGGMQLAAFRPSRSPMDAADFDRAVRGVGRSLGGRPLFMAPTDPAAETDAGGEEPFTWFDPTLDLRPSLRFASFQEPASSGTAAEGVSQEEEEEEYPFADDDGIDAVEMAKIAEAMNNPLGHLWMLFTQHDVSWYDGDIVRAGSRKTNHTTAFQPVLPFKLTEEWSVIARPTLLVNSFTAPDGFDVVEGEPEDPPSVVLGDFNRETGLGDMILPLWFSARTKPPFVIGAGPTFMFPTATDDILGTEQWSVGPSALAVYLDDEFIIGAVLQHWWSFATEDSDRDHVNLTDVQVIYRYRVTPMTNIGGSPNIRYNWDTDEATIPLGIGADTLIMLGRAPVRIGAEFHYYPEQPDAYGPEFMIRFLLIPVIPAPAFAKEPLFGR